MYKYFNSKWTSVEKTYDWKHYGVKDVPEIKNNQEQIGKGLERYKFWK